MLIKTKVNLVSNIQNDLFEAMLLLPEPEIATVRKVRLLSIASRLFNDMTEYVFCQPEPVAGCD